MRVADSRCSVSTACERLLCAFMRVSLVRRRARPRSIILAASATAAQDCYHSLLYINNSSLQDSIPPREPSLYVADPRCSVSTACERLLCTFTRVYLVRR